MKTCEEYQIDISAMLDGELTPAEIADTVQHLSECGECKKVFEQFRAMQDTVNREFAAPALPRSIWRNIEREAERGKSPEEKSGRVIEFRKWTFRIVSVAAGIIIAFMMGYFLGEPSAPMLIDPNTPIVLASDKGHMSDDRFQQLTRELLSADQKYQQKMYFILHTLNSEYIEGSMDPPAFEDNDYNDKLRLINSAGDGETVRY